MKKLLTPFSLSLVLAGVLVPSSGFAQATIERTNILHVLTNAVEAVVNGDTGNTATNPVPRDPKWVKRHEGFVEEAKKGGVDILFMGDSITDFWRVPGPKGGSNVWAKFYAPRHAIDFGISGDRTEHVLWRMNNGELEGIKPKVVVLMIGTNNSGKEKNGTPRNSVPQIIQGVQAVVQDLRTKLPDSKILLLGVFPRGATLDDAQRAQVALVNTVIAKLDDGKMIRFLDITPHFLDSDGTLPKSIMPDSLHPNERGYLIWADAMEPLLAEMLK